MLPELLTETGRWRVKQESSDIYNRIGLQYFIFNKDGTLEMNWSTPEYPGKGTWSCGKNGFDGKHNGPDYYSLYIEYSCGNKYGFGVDRGMLFFGSEYIFPKGNVMSWDKDGALTGVVSIELEQEPVG